VYPEIPIRICWIAFQLANAWLESRAIWALSRFMRSPGIDYIAFSNRFLSQRASINSDFHAMHRINKCSTNLWESLIDDDKSPYNLPISAGEAHITAVWR